MTRYNPPEGYGVVQVVPKAWCALEIERLTLPEEPEEQLVCTVLSEQGKQALFSRRQDAVILCHLDAWHQEYEEWDHWEYLAATAEVYPDRCIHYVEEIVAITGQAPLIARYPSYPGWYVAVGVMGYECLAGGVHHTRWFSGPTQEDALEQAGEYAYADQFRCGCGHQWTHTWTQQERIYGGGAYAQSV